MFDVQSAESNEYERSVHLLAGMKNRQVDFILAYTQAPVDCEIYMCTPAQFIVKDGTFQFSENPTPGNSYRHVLFLAKNLFGLHVQPVITGSTKFGKVYGLNKVPLIPVSLFKKILLCYIC